MNNEKIDTGVKDKIASILKLPDTNGWVVTDFISDKGLYCIHYDKYADMSKYGHLRGIIVDVANEIVVCKSYGHTPTVEIDEIGFESGCFKFKDVSDYEHIVDVSRVRFRVGYESTVMRVWKHDGDVYTSTHRRINPEKSRWGTSIPFKKMYENLEGPTTELFGEEPYSPWCHLFLMVHPDILIASKLPVGKGFLVYLGAIKVWNPEDTHFDKLKGFSSIDLTKPHEPKNVTNKQPFNPEKPVIFKSGDITLPEANRHLKYGFYNDFKMHDRRLETGEFVIMTEVDEKDEVIRTFKISSVPYSWRNDMRDNNPNLYHRFFQLADGQFINTETPFGLEQYEAKFPLLTHYKQNELHDLCSNGEGFVVWPQLDETSSHSGDVRGKMLDTPEKRRYNIWQCYVASAPLHNQKFIIDMYNQYVDDRYKVIKWLQDIELSNVLLDNIGSEYSDRVKNIIEETRKYAAVLDKRGVSSKFKSMKQLVHKNIYDLIMKEGGFSLYRLRKLMLYKENPDYNKINDVTQRTSKMRV